ncbi:hypothetical protein JZ751_025810, partial [Albula glossodonta]
MTASLELTCCDETSHAIGAVACVPIGHYRDIVGLAARQTGESTGGIGSVTCSDVPHAALRNHMILQRSPTALPVVIHTSDGHHVLPPTLQAGDVTGRAAAVAGPLMTVAGLSGRHIRDGTHSGGPGDGHGVRV